MSKEDLEKEFAESNRVMKELGCIDENNQLSAKGFDVLRSLLLTKEDISEHKDIGAETILRMRTDIANFHKHAAEASNEIDEKDKPHLMIATMVMSLENLVAELVQWLQYDIIALATNHLELRDNVKELLGSFEKSERDQKDKLIALAAKMEEQEKLMLSSKKYVKFFQRWEVDRTKHRGNI